MSDYLDNLLTRSIGTGESVQPRPVSLFEPLPGTAWRPPAPLAEPDADLEQDGPQPASPRREPGFQPAGLELLPARSVSAGPEPESPDVPRTPSPSQTVVSPRPTSTDPQKATAEPPSRVLAPPDREDAPQPVVARTVMEHVDRRSDPTPAALPQPAAEAPRAVDGGSRSVAVRPATAIAQPRSATEGSRMLAKGPRSMTEGSRSAAHERTAPVQPQPTIQVTIGRIEVQAAPAPATPLRKATPAAPMTSLEDYMRQRKGGAR